MNVLGLCADVDPGLQASRSWKIRSFLGCSDVLSEVAVDGGIRRVDFSPNEGGYSGVFRNDKEI